MSAHKIVFFLAVTITVIGLMKNGMLVEANQVDVPFCCKNGEKCVPSGWRNWRCDGEDNCSDGSDEENCEDYTCTQYDIKCKDGKQCIHSWQRCDSYKGCSDGSDEENCEDYTCPANMFQCRNGICIPSYKRCDGGKPDCSDGSDEEDCENYTCPEFTCKNGYQCTLNDYKCDNFEDCEDGSDESNC